MNHQNNQPQSELPGPEESQLWLTPQLMKQLTRLAGPGLPAMNICLAIGISYGVMEMYFRLSVMQRPANRDFYLLEPSDFYLTLTIAKPLILSVCLLVASYHGIRAWRLLRRSDEDDDALLDGTAGLVSMFKWLSIWAGLLTALGLMVEGIAWIGLR